MERRGEDRGQLDGHVLLVPDSTPVTGRGGGIPSKHQASGEDESADPNEASLQC